MYYYYCNTVANSVEKHKICNNINFQNQNESSIKKTYKNKIQFSNSIMDNEICCSTNYSRNYTGTKLHKNNIIHGQNYTQIKRTRITKDKIM